MPFIPYWVFPIISGLVWLGMLLGMLTYWCVDMNFRHYSSMEPGQQIAYISDVGADYLKPLFITGCIVTTVTLDISFVLDRYFRHEGRLVPNTTTVEKVLSVLCILCAIIGTCGLILLSIFDTARHPQLHDLFLLLFIAGYMLSAIFICCEYYRLGIRNNRGGRPLRQLRYSFWVKLIFIVVELALAIIFVGCDWGEKQNAAAVLEWVVAFVFSFYAFSFWADLWPAVYTRGKRSTRTGKVQIEQKVRGHGDSDEMTVGYLHRDDSGSV